MSERSELSRLARHSTIYTVGNALNRVGAFVLLPLYTRYLTPAQYGTLELFYAFSAIISSVLSVGIAHATLRFYFDYKDQKDRYSVVSTNLIASFTIGVAGAAIVGTFGPTLVAVVLSADPPRWALTIILATLVLELSTQVCLAFLRAREQSMFFIVVVLGKLVVQCVANTILVIYFEAGIDGVLAGNGLAVASGWIVLVAYTLRQCGLRFELAKLIPVLRYSLPFLYTTVLAVVVANVDRFLINKLLSLEALGIFALATKFSRLITDLVGEPFARAYGAFRYTVMERDDAAQIQAQVVRIVVAMLAFVSLGVVFFTGDVLRLMSAPQFWPAGSLMPLLTIAASVHTITYAFQTGILYKKTTGELFRISVWQSVIGIVASLTLMPLLGLTGACLAALVHAVAGGILTYRAGQRHFPVRYQIGPYAILFGLTGACYLASLPLASVDVTFALPLKVLLLGLFAVVTFSSTVVAPQERRALINLLGGVFRRSRRPH